MLPVGSHTTILVDGFELKLLEADFNGAGGVKSSMAISSLGKVDRSATNKLTCRGFSYKQITHCREISYNKSPCREIS